MRESKAYELSDADYSWLASVIGLYPRWQVGKRTLELAEKFGVAVPE
jgi:hypothetical protein